MKFYNQVGNWAYTSVFARPIPPTYRGYDVFDIEIKLKITKSIVQYRIFKPFF